MRITWSAPAARCAAATAAIEPGSPWATISLTSSSPTAAISRRLFDRGEIAATPMTGWGPSGERYLRLVFANEPLERLGDLRSRFDAALA